MIEFIQEENPSKETRFSDVGVNQFFISLGGELCQKVSANTYITIASEIGSPYADVYDDQIHDHLIEKVLPRITEIKF